jgi:hypothetical protein
MPIDDPSYSGSDPLAARLAALAYISSAVREFSEHELHELLHTSRKRNQMGRVTGLLLYGQMSFMQYLEGPCVPLKQIYASILRDPRHCNVIELFHEPVEAREFSDWAMAFTPLEAQRLLTEPGESLVQHLVRETAGRGSRARALLRTFWPRMTAR